MTGPARFLAARAFEQVKIDVAYNKTIVKVIGVISGVSYGPLGGTHTSTHDYAGMRALPNLTVLAPSDNVQAASLTEYLVRTNGPAYMRMGRGDVEGIYRDGEQFDVGVAKEVNKGSDITSCCETVWHALQAAGRVEKDAISARVLDMFTIKPLDEAAVDRPLAKPEYHHLGNQPVRRAKPSRTLMATSATPVPMRIMVSDEGVLVGESAELLLVWPFGRQCNCSSQRPAEIVNINRIFWLSIKAQRDQPYFLPMARWSPAKMWHTVKSPIIAAG